MDTDVQFGKTQRGKESLIVRNSSTATRKLTQKENTSGDAVDGKHFTAKLLSKQKTHKLLITFFLITLTMVTVLLHYLEKPFRK